MGRDLYGLTARLVLCYRINTGDLWYTHGPNLGDDSPPYHEPDHTLFVECALTYETPISQLIHVLASLLEYCCGGVENLIHTVCALLRQTSRYYAVIPSIKITIHRTAIIESGGVSLDLELGNY